MAEFASGGGALAQIATAFGGWLNQGGMDMSAGAGLAALGALAMAAANENPIANARNDCNASADISPRFCCSSLQSFCRIAGLAATPSHAQSLTGAGATFPYPVYSKWFDAYAKATGVKVSRDRIWYGANVALELSKPSPALGR